MIRGKRPKHESRRRSQQTPWPLPSAQSAPAVVSLSDAAHYLGIHLSTLRRWILNGKVKAVPRVAGSDETPAGVEMAEIVRMRDWMAAEQKRLTETER